MKVRQFTFVLALAIIFLMGQYAPAGYRQGRRGSSFRLGYNNYYRQSGHYRQGHHYGSRGHYRNYSYYRPHYYRSYSYRPSRRRSRVGVSVYYDSGGFYVTAPIPAIVVNKAIPKPIVLVRGGGFDTRREFLIETLRRDAEPDRLLAGRELKEYKDITSVAALTNALVNDPSAKVRKVAAQSMGEIGLAGGYLPLVRIGREDHEAEVRKAAKQAAQTIKNSTEPRKIFHYDQSPAMQHGTQKLATYIAEVRYGRRNVRKKAVKAMNKYHSTRAVAALIDVLINDSSESVREEAAQSLGKIGDAMALPFLKAASVNDIEDDVREDSIKAIAKIHRKL